MNKLTQIKRLADVGLSYARARLEVKHPPFRLWIEPTNICNLRCPMCPQSLNQLESMGHMSMDLFARVIDEVKDFAFDINLHHTGESERGPPVPGVA